MHSSARAAGVAVGDTNLAQWVLPHFSDQEGKDLPIEVSITIVSTSGAASPGQYQQVALCTAYAVDVQALPQVRSMQEANARRRQRTLAGSRYPAATPKSPI
eukprot:scaffold837_cov416-Prasinococcus_capsulatus_cf.AAC.11